MDNAKYTKHLCAFIDILGYKNLVDQVEKGVQSVSIIEVLEEIVQKCIKEYLDSKNDTDNEKYSYEIFSDSIIITTPVNDCKDKDEYLDNVYFKLYKLILMVCGIQVQSLKYDIIFRGAISIGNHYRSKNIMFSKALINAYKAEEHEALYPRVIIDIVNNEDETFCSPDILNELVYNKMLLKDKSCFFIDYIERIFMLGAMIPSVYEIILEQHKKFIENNLKLYQSSESVASKYVWLAKYYNYKIGSRYKGIEIYQEDSLELGIEKPIDRVPVIITTNDQETKIIDVRNLKPGETIIF